jgi:hypothetical protein
MSDDEGSRPKPDPKPEPKQDIVFVHSPTEQGDGLRVIRKREETIEVGELRRIQEGQPIHGEVVKLNRREEHERLFDVEVLVPREEIEARGSRSGPAQVATRAYRDNWETIFGSKDDKKPSLPN